MTDSNPLDVARQVDSLLALDDGWLDGDGRAPGRPGLRWLLGAFGDHFPEDAPVPYLYPTPEGGVQAEWTLGEAEVSLEIALGRRRGIFAVDRDDESEERELDLGTPEAWNWLGDRLCRLQAAAE